ncbi:hypothetical protein IG631_13668 [Alternaria alternata]|nr:hypothetical protein IG631_13668 [Alternaria alternata]
MAHYYHVFRRSLFRLVCAAPDVSLSSSCDGRCLRTIRLAYLQPTLCGTDTKDLAVSRVSPATARETFTHDASPPDLRGDTQPPTPQYQAANVQLPSFRFQPSSFVPANTKARLVLKLSSPATARDTPSLHQTYAGTADLTSRLTQVFFQPGAVADAERTRLLNQAHFVLFNDQLKSIRLPSAAVHVAAQELSLDWRQLCHTFMRDEFKCRFGSSASVAWWRKFP